MYQMFVTDMKDFLLSDKAEMVIAVTMNEGEHEKNS
jgi:hypothetical protein